MAPPHSSPVKGGPVAIPKSTDNGVSWATPVTLLNGSFQTAPTPVVEADGVLYRTMEDSAVGGCGAWLVYTSPSPRDS